jgi:hypothetical protein
MGFRELGVGSRDELRKAAQDFLVAQVSGISELRRFDKNPSPGQTLIVTDVLILGEPTTSLYKWESGSFEPDDGEGVISIPGTDRGRWIRQENSASIESQTIAEQAAADAAAAEAAAAASAADAAAAEATANAAQAAADAAQATADANTLNKVDRAGDTMTGALVVEDRITIDRDNDVADADLFLRADTGQQARVDMIINNVITGTFATISDAVRMVNQLPGNGVEICILPDGIIEMRPQDNTTIDDQEVHVVGVGASGRPILRLKTDNAGAEQDRAVLFWNQAANRIQLDNRTPATDFEMRISDTLTTPNDQLTFKFSSGAIKTPMWQEDNVPTDKVVTDSILDGAVTLAKMATDSVDTAQLVDDAVTNAKIADDAVDTPQLANLAVNNARIDNLAVTNSKIAEDTIQANKFSRGSTTGTANWTAGGVGNMQTFALSLTSSRLYYAVEITSVVGGDNHHFMAYLDAPGGDNQPTQVRLIRHHGGSAAKDVNLTLYYLNATF